MRTLLFPALLVAASTLNAADAELLSTSKIYASKQHSAFTDLTRFRDRFFCVFRESEAHVGGNGQIRVLASADGEKWESAAVLTETGIDLRDPKLSHTPDGQLMLTIGGSVYEGKKLMARQPRVSFSKDGETWTVPHRVLAEGDWLWRVTWHKGVAYGTSYRTDTPDGQLLLYSSKDGKEWQKVTDLKVPGQPNETTLRFTKDGEMMALVRREAGSRKAWFGRSSAPYTDWKWLELKHQIGGPDFIVLPDGTMWAGGRQYTGGVSTVLARLTTESYDPVVKLPSGGDTSYPGFVWHNDILWMSYYSSHEKASNIYLAKFKLK